MPLNNGFKILEANSPLSLGGGVVFLDPTNFNSITPNGTKVSAISDGYGRGNGFFEGSSSAQPVYSEDEFNGQPGLDFTTWGVEMLGSSWIATRGDYTCFVLFKTTYSGLDNFFLGQDAVGWGDKDTQFRISSTGEVQLYTQGPAVSEENLVSTVSTYNDGNPHLAAFNVNGTSYDLYVDSEHRSITSSSSGVFGADGSTAVALGSKGAVFSARIQAVIGPVVIFPRSLSAAEMTFVSNYYSNKFGVGI